MTDLLRVRMWAMGLAMEHTPEDADREATEIVAQWLVDWVTEKGAAHEPELPPAPVPTLMVQSLTDISQSAVPIRYVGRVQWPESDAPSDAPPCDVEF